MKNSREKKRKHAYYHLILSRKHQYISLFSLSFDPYCKGDCDMLKNIVIILLLCVQFIFAEKFSLQVGNVSHAVCAIRAIYMDNGKYIWVFELTGKSCKNKECLEDKVGRSTSSCILSASSPGKNNKYEIQVDGEHACFLYF